MTAISMLAKLRRKKPTKQDSSQTLEPRCVCVCVCLCVEKECVKQTQRHKDSWLVVFYGLSTIVGYLMPNPVYTYIVYMICKRIVCK